ncbi:Plexin-A2 [Trachymyrmex septentrionalis]|uniref:Plexin-A2 n=1 Tax=Trachymyrmex septentrionalis TaxID=34720 RepID=A0A195FIC3_9HYME|nr:Plexin-A2 [Trachymyrmex septentrionalis]
MQIEPTSHGTPAANELAGLFADVDTCAFVCAHNTPGWRIILSVDSYKLQTIGEDFCGLDVNTPLGGEEPMGATAVLTFETHLTAVAATSTGDYTVVFVGTNKGHLKKVSA